MDALGCLDHGLRSKRLFPLVVYSSVALLVLYDLLLPGYVLTLDMVFAPGMKVLPPERVDLWDAFYGFEYPWPSGIVPFLAALSALSRLVDAWIIQKVILFLILFLSGVSAHRLCPAEHEAGKYFAGLLYMLNPFVYVRFMVGHWLILLAYSITPFAVKAMIGFFEDPKVRGGVRVALFLTVVGVFSSHLLLLDIFIMIAFFLAKAAGSRDRSKLVMRTMMVLAILVPLNAYWIVPSLFEKTVLTQISYEDLVAFTSRSWGAGFNILFSAASLHGFWRQPEGYTYISNVLPYWYLAYGFILFLAIQGFLAETHDKKMGVYVGALGTVAVASLFAATGISTPYFSGFFKLVFEATSFLRGFREPQKFVAVLALAYSLLGGLGVSELLLGIKKGRRRMKRVAALAFTIIALTTPFTYSLNMLGGFNGQLKPVDYPKEWYEANDYLNSREDSFNILFFPWHLYMAFTWTDRTIPNPASAFFDHPVVSGENIEVNAIETQSTKPVQRYIDFLLKNRERITDFGALVAPLNIKYIVLAKETDYSGYSFLYRQQDLKPVLDNPRIIVFENQRKTSEIYGAKGIRIINSWDDLLKTSGEDLTEYVYLFASDSAQQTNTAEKRRVNLVQASPVEYRVQVDGGGYLVFTGSYGEEWRLGDDRPLPNLGLTNAFYADSPGVYRMYFSKFDMLLAYYLLSLVALAVCVVYVLHSVRKRW